MRKLREIAVWDANGAPRTVEILSDGGRGPYHFRTAEGEGVTPVTRGLFRLASGEHLTTKRPGGA
jgi:hypothetical protein